MLNRRELVREYTYVDLKLRIRFFLWGTHL